MTKKEKLLAKFLENPRSLTYSQILTLLGSLWYTEENASGSHKKIIHTDGTHIAVSIHGKDCKPWLKDAILTFYLSHQNTNENTTHEL